MYLLRGFLLFLLPVIVCHFQFSSLFFASVYCVQLHESVLFPAAPELTHSQKFLAAMTILAMETYSSNRQKNESQGD